MKFIPLVCGVMVASAYGMAKNIAKTDTTIQRMLQEAHVSAIRASERTPMAFTSMNKAEIAARNTGKDIPSLLEASPSVLTSSDAGMGIGYSGLRVRGTDATRINITLNGIPMNDAESSCMYWVNVPDLASSLEGVQIQRGLGTSTNGSGAFGASINMQSENLSKDAYFRADLSGGSYATHKESVSFGTGLLKGKDGKEGKWALSGRLSNIGSDGYIKRASTRLNAYFLQGGYFGENTVVKLITYNGTERTYHAWDYASRDDIAAYGRNYNPCGRYIDDKGNVAFYDDQTDNYHLQNYQLLWNQHLVQHLNMNLVLHYSHGNGYYEQYMCNQPLYLYRLPEQVGIESDLIHRKQMDNDFYGTVFSFNYNKASFDAIVGGGWNRYDGNQFGNVIWLRNSMDNINPNHQYYDNDSRKQDFNLYGKLNKAVGKGVNVYADLQYRHISYSLQGPSEYFDGMLQKNFDINAHFNFFNPKAGILWDINPHHQLYASVARGYKEPMRNDFVNTTDFDAKAEKLTDWEMGYKLKTATFAAGMNLYYMAYKDQLALTGEQDNIGAMIARNIGKSYRTGVEMTARWQPLKCFTWDANATLSRNRAKNLKFFLDDTQEYLDVKSAPLTFSPNFMLNNVFKWNHKNLDVRLQSQYVSEQYMTTSGLRSYEDAGKSVSLMLNPYFVSNLDCSYAFRKIKGIRNLVLGITIYNLFNEKYESFGAASTAIKSDGHGGMMGYQTSNWDSYSVYSVQAPIHFLAHLSIEF